MSRSALYREYRPQDLSDVVGQEHITGLLETALSRQKLTHAYLFTGPRGTGKTSVARILARRVNELSTKTELESELDIIEIDAASNRGIDEIRALRDKVATAPSRLKYKIFIIDEAHMLTREAFNALLKTLEEPPAHAIFILATTEVHKLPDTVISRTQRYDFRPVRPSGMLSHLRMVAEAESMRIDDGALEAIAELSGGGFRDALSLLDQLGATDGQITRQLVTKLVGIGDEVAVGELILLTGQGRCDDALDLLSKLWDQGAEPTLLNEYILLLARKQFIEHSSKSGLSKAQLAKLLDSFLRASRELKTSPIPTLPLELAVWRLSKDADHEPISSAQSGTIRHRPEPSSGSNKQSKATSTVKLPQEVLGEEKITAKALSLIKSKNNSLYAVLRSGSPALQGDKLLLRCRFRFHKERIEEPKNQQFIETVFSKVAGRQIEMMVTHAGAENTTTESKSPEDELVASALEILGGEVSHESAMVKKDSLPVAPSEEELAKLSPPHSIQAERSLLGTIFLESDSLIKVADIVGADDFYDRRNGMIYETIVGLYEKRRPIDLITLSEDLKSRKELDNIGGMTYLTELAGSEATTAHAPEYARIVAGKATLRRLDVAGHTISGLAHDETRELEGLLDEAEQALFSVSQKHLKQNFISIKDVLADSFDRLDALHKDKQQLRGVPTGFREMDRLLAGLQRSDLIILAARPSMGKTSFAMNIASHVAIKEGIPVGIFSLEMSKEQLIDRLLASESGIDSWKLRTGNLEDKDFEKLNRAMGVMAEAPIFIDDSAMVNALEMRTKARRLQTEHGLGLVIIDYLQLMSGRSSSDGNRVNEISEISRSLKGLARELDVPVIALSQLSRAVEQRHPQIPQLSDLRESGSIEQDADVVMFIYREDYYNKESERRNISDILIRKHRNGPTGDVELFFSPELMLFRSLDKKRQGS